MCSWPVEYWGGLRRLTLADRRSSPATPSRTRKPVGAWRRSPQQPECARDLVAEITLDAATEWGLADGAVVWAGVKATETTLVPL
ncbi:TOBE domain-containing protein [Streptomyces sp. HMX87]|uniref:TOBE domain-containing protein n=1 Tax=Streptomyces sp. HMX87 TaxID=3390849 RepID=UPI003A8993E1